MCLLIPLPEDMHRCTHGLTYNSLSTLALLDESISQLLLKTVYLYQYFLLKLSQSTGVCSISRREDQLSSNCCSEIDHTQHDWQYYANCTMYP